MDTCLASDHSINFLLFTVVLQNHYRLLQGQPAASASGDAGAAALSLTQVTQADSIQLTGVRKKQT